MIINNTMYKRIEKKINLANIKIKPMAFIYIRLITTIIIFVLLLISNKYVAKRGTKCVVIGAYTERQTYMEGYEYSGYLTDKTISHRNKLLLDFFSGSVDAMEHLKKEGVTHLIRFENIPVSLPDVGMKVIYKNGAVTVFEFLPYS